MAGAPLSTLQKRILMTLVMSSLTLSLLWTGGWPFAVYAVLVSLILLREWINLARRTTRPVLLGVAGVLYIGLCVACIYFLRIHFGFLITMLFMLMIWASDIAAYISGRVFGGPKMTPTISPNKTWAGLGGAMAAPVFVMMVYVYMQAGALDPLGLSVALASGVVLGLVGQAGDLLVSLFKRLAGTKDSSTLIPGHGGLLDRMDAMLLCAPVFFFIATKFIHVLTG